MPLDIARLLEPVAPEAPCGEDLQYAAADLRDRARGARRSVVVDGREQLVVTPPDWRQLERDALALAGRGKDLWLWVILARAALQRDGLPGLVAGLRLIADGLDRYWPDIHPALDLEETDPEQQAFKRRNALNLLADPEGLLSELHRVPILSARGYGQFSLRALRLAAGEQRPAPGEEPPDPKIVAAALGEAKPDEVAERDRVRAAAAEIPRLVERIGTVFAARTGKAEATPSLEALVERIGTVFAARTGKAEATPSLEALVGFAQDVLRRLPEPAAEPVVPDDPVPVVAEPNGKAGEPVPSPGAVAPAASRQGVDGREDVMRLLDQILDYYRRREPSSPVPLLLQRARRLVPMSFVEAMRELAPSGVDELVRVAGHLEDSGT